MAKRKLYSLSALATECGRNFRTLSKALSDVKPDGKAPDGKPKWHLATAISALAERERLTGRPSSRPALPRYDARLEAQIAGVEQTGREVDALLAALRAEPAVERRREMVERGDGRCIGAHMRALSASIGSGADAPLRRVFCDSMMERITSELLQLCEWRLDETGQAA
jgi:hypothetical protein